MRKGRVTVLASNLWDSWIWYLLKVWLIFVHGRSASRRTFLGTSSFVSKEKDTRDYYCDRVSSREEGRVWSAMPVGAVVRARKTEMQQLCTNCSGGHPFYFLVPVYMCVIVPENRSVSQATRLCFFLGRVGWSLHCWPPLYWAYHIGIKKVLHLKRGVI